MRGRDGEDALARESVSVRERCSAGGALLRETEGSREMGIVASLRWVVMERTAGERGMGQRDEGWR